MHKRHLIFLHGALGSKKQWERFQGPFKENFQVHALDFPGHGDSTLKPGKYTCDTFTDFVQAYISQNHIPDFSVIGYSLGGYIGLNMTLRKIQGYHSLITLSTKLNWDKAIAAEVCANLTIEKLSTIAELLRQEHGENFNQLLFNTREIISSIGNNALSKSLFTGNNIPVLMLLGSNDKLVSPEEIKLFSEDLPSFNTHVLEQQPHAIEKMDTRTITQACMNYLKM